MDRFLAGTDWYQSSLHPHRCDDCLDLYRTAFCGPHLATSLRRVGSRSRRGGIQPGCLALANVSTGHLPKHPTLAHHRHCLAFARALGEYGSVVFISGKYADEDRDHLTAHHYQARTIRLPRRDGHCRRHVVDLFRSLAGDQWPAVVDFPWLSRVDKVTSHDASHSTSHARSLVVAGHSGHDSLAFVTLFLILPLAVVFAEAFREGWSAYAKAFAIRCLAGDPTDPDRDGDCSPFESGLRYCCGLVYRQV